MSDSGLAEGGDGLTGLEACFRFGIVLLQKHLRHVQVRARCEVWLSAFLLSTYLSEIMVVPFDIKSTNIMLLWP